MKAFVPLLIGGLLLGPFIYLFRRSTLLTYYYGGRLCLT